MPVLDYLAYYTLAIWAGCRKEAISANNPRFHFRANRATTVVYSPFLARKLLVRSPVAIVYLDHFFPATSVASVEKNTIV